MLTSLDAINDALVEASYALHAIPDDATTGIYELQLKKHVDMKIYEALSTVRAWHEYLEEGGQDDN